MSKKQNDRNEVFNMDYVMYIQNGGNLGHAEFDDYEKAYEAMKIMTARHIGIGTDMLDNMIDSNGDGPFFYVRRESAFVESNGTSGSLSIRIEEVPNPIHAYAELNIEKTYICLTLMDQFDTVMTACLERLDELEMEPTGVLTMIGSLKGIYDCLKAVDIDLDEAAEEAYQKLLKTMNFYLGTEE